MGTYVRKLTEKVNLVASENTWIEGLAEQQLMKTSELENMARVCGMPDLHPGKGYPIGAAFFSTGKIYPALVGNDIGCGMSLWQSSIKLSRLNLDKLSKRLKNIEQPLSEDWHGQIERRKYEKNIPATAYDFSLGTIGGGNHFAEFQQIVEIYDDELFNLLNLDKKQLQLLVHSGSRGLGQSILTQHIRQHNHDGLKTDDEDFDTYLLEHDEAVRWAELNRELIALRFLDAVKATGTCQLDINHNLVVEKEIEGQSGWLHRKGATPSDSGFVVIPGSRGDYSYIVEPIPSEKSLYSLAHGAGRKWKRGDCKDRLSHKYKKEDLYKTALGSRVICGDKTLLYDEAPQAYKDCTGIVSDLVNANLVKLVAKLKPVLTFKTNGECHG